VIEQPLKVNEMKLPIKEPQEKKKLIKSYVSGIIDQKHGENYTTILRYFLPEFVTSLILYAIIPLVDARWISNLQSTTLFATVGVTNTLLHFLIKTAEGFSVGTVILTGQFNGIQDYKEVGKSLASAFWVTVLVGGMISGILYFGAYWIYALYGVPEKMIAIGIPFLRLKAAGIFCMFVFFAFIGFLRGIKKPRIAMQIFLIGGIIFLFFDYALIYGKWGFPALGLRGSAWASVIQYITMLATALLYIIFDPVNRKYSINLFTHLASWQRITDLFRLSIPVVADKALFALAYIWLGYLINPMGKYAIASYNVIKDLERFAIQPAAAFAQVITFLVSNAYGQQDWKGIKTNIKKVVFLSSIFVFSILAIISIKPHLFINLFDPKNKFTGFAAAIFPLLSVLVFFDLLQLILSGALRGAANVKIVMLARFFVFTCYYLPVSYLLTRLPIENQMVKFLLVYGSFYLGSGLMSLVYIYRFRGEAWKKQVVVEE
jgi:putative MATE family efflux protein